MRSVHLTIRGRVQGVGFRWFVQDTANAHGLAGWVRNRRDGTVEVELHGSDAEVVAALDALVQGPAGARVDDVTTDELPDVQHVGFEIRATG